MNERKGETMVVEEEGTEGRREGIKNVDERVTTKTKRKKMKVKGPKRKKKKKKKNIREIEREKKNKV